MAGNVLLREPQTLRPPAGPSTSPAPRPRSPSARAPAPVKPSASPAGAPPCRVKPPVPPPGKFHPRSSRLYSPPGAPPSPGRSRRPPPGRDRPRPPHFRTGESAFLPGADRASPGKPAFSRARQPPSPPRYAPHTGRSLPPGDRAPPPPPESNPPRGRSIPPPSWNPRKPHLLSELWPVAGFGAIRRSRGNSSDPPDFHRFTRISLMLPRHEPRQGPSATRRIRNVPRHLERRHDG